MSSVVFVLNIALDRHGFQPRDDVIASMAKQSRKTADIFDIYKLTYFDSSINMKIERLDNF